MKRTSLNLLIDGLAAICFLGMIATGYILHFSLPPGTNKSLSLWGLTRHQWGEVHTWISLALLGSLVIHVTLHWPWIVGMVRRQFGWTAIPPGRHVRGAVITVTVLGTGMVVFGWAASSSVCERTDSCCVEPEGDRAIVATPIPKAPPPPKWDEVKRILRESCLSCHGPSRAWSGFRVDRRDDYFGGGQRRPLVIPGDSRNSPLIAIVSGRRSDIAFPERHRLPEISVGVIAQWIETGATWGDPASKEK